jgi:hypothetical protein
MNIPSPAEVDRIQANQFKDVIGVAFDHIKPKLISDYCGMHAIKVTFNAQVAYEDISKVMRLINLELNNASWNAVLTACRPIKGEPKSTFEITLSIKPQ